MKTEGKGSHVTSGSGVGVATPAPVFISVMQMVAGSSRHRSRHFSVSNEKLEQMEAEVNRELSVAEEEENDNDDEEEEEVEGMNEEEKNIGLRASGRDKLGIYSYIEDNQTESLETFEDYLGLETDTHSNSSQLSGRKRKHNEVNISIVNQTYHWTTHSE